MQIASPLHELTSGENAGRTKAVIAWDDRCQQSFDDFKCLCTMAPILAYADSPGHLNSILMLVGMVWGLCSTRLVMMVWIPSLPMPVGV